MVVSNQIAIATINQTENDSDFPGFEGPEKTLEIDFDPVLGPERGLREISRKQWDAILDDAKCTILDTMSNEYIDSYVLSESSLFVYSRKLILKTCGTTTLLMCLPKLIEYTKALGMEIEWLAFTRKNYNFPQVQPYPHRDTQEESQYLKEHFPEGSGFVLGPITGDHYYVYVVDYVDRPTSQYIDRTLNIMMFDICEEVSRLFYKNTDIFPTDVDVTTASGIDKLLPGSKIQEFCFDPCGYSMNGLLYDAYWTIHITPESHCSYASFETNIRMNNYRSLVKAVLAIFKPKKYTMTFFGDDSAVKEVKESPLLPLITVPIIRSDCSVLMGPCIRLEDGTVESAEMLEAASPLSETSDPANVSGDSPKVSLRIATTPAKKTAAHFVSAHRTQIDFMGYRCALSNYRLVDAPLGAKATASISEVPVKAVGVVDTPRAKYILKEEIDGLTARPRASSV